MFPFQQATLPTSVKLLPEDSGNPLDAVTELSCPRKTVSGELLTTINPIRLEFGAIISVAEVVTVTAS